MAVPIVGNYLFNSVWDIGFVIFAVGLQVATHAKTTSPSFRGKSLKKTSTSRFVWFRLVRAHESVRWKESDSRVFFTDSLPFVRLRIETSCWSPALRAGCATLWEPL